MRKLVSFSIEFSSGQAIAWEIEKKVIILLDGEFFAIEKERGDQLPSESYQAQEIPELGIGIVRIVPHYTSRSGLSGSWTVLFEESTGAQLITTVRVDSTLFERTVSSLQFPCLFYDRQGKIFNYCDLTESEVAALPKGRVVAPNAAPYPLYFIDRCPLLRACGRTVRIDCLDAQAIEVFPQIWRLRSGEIVEASDEEIADYRLYK